MFDTKDILRGLGVNDIIYSNIKLVDPAVKSIEGDSLPKYQTTGSAGFDIYAREEHLIKPGGMYIVWSNFIIQVPVGYMLMLAVRSSLPKKLGLHLANGIGIIDQDYHGNEDVIGVQLYNPTECAVAVPQGYRVAQGVFVSIAQAVFTQVEDMEATNRGGFGSTGGYDKTNKGG